jgi:hypothetical protein
VEGFNRQLLTAQQRLELDRPKPPELKIVPPGAKAIDAAGKVVMENPREPAPEKPPTLGSFEDYVKRSFGENPTPEQIRQARKDYQQADDRPRVTVTTSGGDVAMSPDAVDTAAHRVMLFGPSSIPTRFNDNDKKTILNREAEINKAIGNTPAVAAMRSAVQKADQGALNKITTLAAAAEAFENKALQQADLVKSLSEKVDRTKLPLVNGVLVSGKALLGNTPAHLLANALLTYTSEYAKLIEGSAGSAAGSSDSARLAAATLVSKALSKGTLNATVDQMNKEMAMTRNGYNTTIQDITERMGGGTATPTAAPKPTGRFNPATGKVEPIQ